MQNKLSYRKRKDTSSQMIILRPVTHHKDNNRNCSKEKETLD